MFGSTRQASPGLAASLGNLFGPNVEDLDQAGRDNPSGSLQRKLDEANTEIAALRARLAEGADIT